MEPIMPNSPDDSRSSRHREQDERIASEPPRPSPVIAPGAVPTPVEAHLPRRRRPLALSGVVENGVVRLLDPRIKLPEHSRVIVVASVEA